MGLRKNTVRLLASLAVAFATSALRAADDDDGGNGGNAPTDLVGHVKREIDDKVTEPASEIKYEIDLREAGEDAINKTAAEKVEEQKRVKRMNEYNNSKKQQYAAQQNVANKRGEWNQSKVEVQNRQKNLSQLQNEYDSLSKAPKDTPGKAEQMKSLENKIATAKTDLANAQAIEKTKATNLTNAEIDLDTKTQNTNKARQDYYKQTAAAKNAHNDSIAANKKYESVKKNGPDGTSPKKLSDNIDAALMFLNYGEKGIDFAEAANRGDTKKMNQILKDTGIDMAQDVASMLSNNAGPYVALAVTTYRTGEQLVEAGKEAYKTSETFAKISARELANAREAAIVKQLHGAGYSIEDAHSLADGYLHGSPDDVAKVESIYKDKNLGDIPRSETAKLYLSEAGNFMIGWGKDSVKAIGYDLPVGVVKQVGKVAKGAFVDAPTIGVGMFEKGVAKEMAMQVVRNTKEAIGYIIGDTLNGSTKIKEVDKDAMADRYKEVLVKNGMSEEEAEKLAKEFRSKAKNDYNGAMDDMKKNVLEQKMVHAKNEWDKAFAEEEKNPTKANDQKTDDWMKVRADLYEKWLKAYDPKGWAEMQAEKEKEQKEKEEAEIAKEAEKAAAEAAKKEEAAKKAEEAKKAAAEAAKKEEEEKKAAEEAAKKAEEEKKASEEAAKKAEEEKKASEEAAKSGDKDKTEESKDKDKTGGKTEEDTDKNKDKEKTDGTKKSGEKKSNTKKNMPTNCQKCGVPFDKIPMTPSIKHPDLWCWACENENPSDLEYYDDDESGHFKCAKCGRACSRTVTDYHVNLSAMLLSGGKVKRPAGNHDNDSHYCPPCMVARLREKANASASSKSSSSGKVNGTYSSSGGPANKSNTCVYTCDYCGQGMNSFVCGKGTGRYCSNACYQKAIKRK